MYGKCCLSRAFSILGKQRFDGFKKKGRQGCGKGFAGYVANKGRWVNLDL
jgi:hypothetical protein